MTRTIDVSGPRTCQVVSVASASAHLLTSGVESGGEGAGGGGRGNVRRGRHRVGRKCNGCGGARAQGCSFIICRSLKANG